METDCLIDYDSEETLDILGDLHQLCRICLQKGDINIWNEDTSACEDASDETSITPIELMNIFANSKEDVLVLSEVVSLICRKCLNDLKMCYAFYQKLKLSSVTIKSLYEETGDCTEQQSAEAVPSSDNNIRHLSLNPYELETVIQSSDNCLEVETNDLLEQQICEKEALIEDASSSPHSEIIIDERIYENGAMIVAKFLPTDVELNVDNIDVEKSPKCTNEPKQLTVDYKPVEIYDVSSLVQKIDNNPPNENFMFKCKYCPQAFAKSSYLQTHAQAAHLCKFCTQAFNVTQDLFRHLRTAHKEHKCVICHKSFTTNSNLRCHIKRMHKIDLPAGVALIDFIHQ